MLEPLLGQIALVPYTFAPKGWANCDGQLMSIAQNSALFSLLGTNFGGDGRTTFGLPDLRGRAPVHVGTGPGLSTYVLGARAGAEERVLSTLNLPNHSHSLRGQVAVQMTSTIRPPASSENPTEESPKDNVPAQVFSNGRPLTAYSDTANTTMAPFQADIAGMATLSGNTDNSGGSRAFDIIQPVLGMRYVIALIGTYPSRN